MHSELTTGGKWTQPEQAKTWKDIAFSDPERGFGMLELGDPMQYVRMIKGGQLGNAVPSEGLLFVSQSGNGVHVRNRSRAGARLELYDGEKSQPLQVSGAQSESAMLLLDCAVKKCVVDDGVMILAPRRRSLVDGEARGSGPIDLFALDAALNITVVAEDPISGAAHAKLACAKGGHWAIGTTEDSPGGWRFCFIIGKVGIPKFASCSVPSKSGPREGAAYQMGMLCDGTAIASWEAAADGSRPISPLSRGSSLVSVVAIRGADGAIAPEVEVTAPDDFWSGESWIGTCDQGAVLAYDTRSGAYWGGDIYARVLDRATRKWSPIANVTPPKGMKPGMFHTRSELGFFGVRDSVFVCFSVGGSEFGDVQPKDKLLVGRFDMVVK